MALFRKQPVLPTEADALPGAQRRSECRRLISSTVTASCLHSPAALEQAMFAMDCFWGAEQRSGSFPECIRPRLATPAATQPIPPTKSSVTDGPCFSL
jgi:hypothetical protein